MTSEPKIAILTATFNNALIIQKLIESLIAQTDQDFAWVVADGASLDGTLELLEQHQDKFTNLAIDSRPDFGIYDALNRAIGISDCDYYIVAGADDYFLPNAISDYKKAINSSSADLIVANVHTGGMLKTPRRFKAQSLYGPFAYATSHAVSLAIKRDLHNDYGLYSKYFPIAADQLFLLRAINGGASLSYNSFTAGYFDSENGLSSSNVLGALLEGYHVQILTGQTFIFQTILLFARILKHRWQNTRLHS